MTTIPAFVARPLATHIVHGSPKSKKYLFTADASGNDMMQCAGGIHVGFSWLLVLIASK